MKILILTLAVLFLSCCEETNSVQPSFCYRMIISDALPVQFWASNCETYNEKDACGVFKFCFCQPWECADDIPLQFTDDTQLTYSLFGLDSNGDILFVKPFAQSGSAYNYTLVPENESICDEQISLQIRIQPYEIQNTEMESSGGYWQEQTNDGAGVWSYASFAGYNTTTIGAAGSNRLFGEYSAAQGEVISFDYSVEISTFGRVTRMVITLYNTVTGQSTVINSQNFTSAATFSETLSSGTLAHDVNQIRVKMESVSGAGNTTIKLDYLRDAFGNAAGSAKSGLALGPEILSNGTFDSNLNNWANEGSGSSWVWGAGSGSALGVAAGIIPFGASVPNTKYLTQSVSITKNKSYMLSLDLNMFNFDIGQKCIVTFSGPKGSQQVLVVETDGGTPLEYITDLYFHANNNYNKIKIQITTPNTLIADINIQVDSISLKEITNVFYRTDCLNIKESHECSLLIQYSNNRNYAGLIYEDQSPEAVFYLRIPATFFHEEFPEEDEDIELTSGVQQLNSTMFAQRLMETDYLPYYMHRKLKLVLKHQVVTIENQNWVKREPYEIDKGNKRFPKKMARVLLNESDFVQRNVV